MITDGFAVMLKAILVIAGLLIVAISASHVRREGFDAPEYYALTLFSISGMMMMASSADLIMLFLSLEILSISLYILSGYARTQPRSDESALKYFLLGSFASAFLLFGAAMVYGATESTRFAAVATALTERNLSGDPMLLVEWAW